MADESPEPVACWKSAFNWAVLLGMKSASNGAITATGSSGVNTSLAGGRNTLAITLETRNEPMDEAEIDRYVRGAWNLAGSGARWLNLRGYNVSVLEFSDDRWGWQLQRERGGGQERSPGTYETEAAAKRAALVRLAARINAVARGCRQEPRG
ncbi:MAG: hypothetical protein K2Y37_16525 [Pirellulales bacterium]|nr:hypothetical protein [Pirellulales bacterium]